MAAAASGAVELLERLAVLRRRREAGEIDEAQYREALDRLTRSAQRTEPSSCAARPRHEGS